MAVITATTVPMSSAWTSARSPLSAKNNMNTKIRPALKNSTTHSGVGITPTAPWMRSLRASSRAERLVEPQVEGGLLGRRLRVDRSQRPEQLGPPRIDLLAERPGLHPFPLHAGDRAGIAHELTGQLGGGRRREELRRLDLLRHGEGFRPRRRHEPRRSS